MAERSAVSKLLNGDGPSQPAGSSGSASGGSAGPANLPDGGSTPGSSGGGGQAIFTASSIRALGGKVAALEPMLEKVSSYLEGADIESDSFSGGGIALANVYPQAIAFGRNDAKSKSSQLGQMAEQLKATASTWEQAEQASTVQSQK